MWNDRLHGKERSLFKSVIKEFLSIWSKSLIVLELIMVFYRNEMRYVRNLILASSIWDKAAHKIHFAEFSVLFLTAK